MSAVKVDVCRGGVRFRATTSAEKGQRTSSWAAARGVVAAVNGGFFLGGYDPDGVAVGNGEVWSSDVSWRGWFGFGERRVVFQPAGTVTVPSGVTEAVNSDATLRPSGGVAPAQEHRR